MGDTPLQFGESLNYLDAGGAELVAPERYVRGRATRRRSG